MQSAIATLKTEKTNLNQHLLDLKRRVSELELMIGDENNWQSINLNNKILMLAKKQIPKNASSFNAYNKSKF